MSSPEAESVKLEVGKTYITKKNLIVQIHSKCQPFRKSLTDDLTDGVWFYNGSDNRQYYGNGNVVWADVSTSAVRNHDAIVEESPANPAVPVFVETFESMRIWGEEIFGPVSAKRIVERAGEEFLKELVPAAEHGFTQEATEEAADVVIILNRFPGLRPAACTTSRFRSTSYPCMA